VLVALERYISDYSALLQKHGEDPVTITHVATVDEVLINSDVVSLHCLLDENTKKLINSEKLKLMKRDAIIVNTARGPGNTISLYVSI
jgi:phosphoglycerate dehydrogenase-like enzyme